MKEVLLQTIKAAGVLVKEGFYQDFEVSHKDGINNLVTTIDKASEELIVNTIKAHYPEHGFVGEEFGNENEDAAYKWIIDPIDGTVNFAHHVPLCCISIALTHKEEVIMGAVYNPMMDELFFAEKGKGASLNEKPIRVSTKSNIEQAFLVTGFPYHFPDTKIHPLEIFTKVVAKGLPVRRLGSAALDLCWVACGRFDAFWEYNLQAWDIAAGYLIVEEAGGRVSNFSNQPYTIWDKESLATNGIMHEATLDLLFS
ncbi:inositol monophosphatase [Taibaiella sp. KBW10]|uniref:inositol monophosphatase family protein n=1 Tax=Taibaiella sp. KBW10 TaxID=2153357 RepID=UPI000F5ABF36|nr:inositol monophosphatase family protein [Taibaiella sp. KBW10]RQO30845.1 inositol monophosphatase [Taibaiella sp. KBW10]